MANYKNSRPKPYTGCCKMCACRTRDGGLRNKHIPSVQELRACPPVEDWETDLQLLAYDDWARSE